MKPIGNRDQRPIFRLVAQFHELADFFISQPSNAIVAECERQTTVVAKTRGRANQFRGLHCRFDVTGRIMYRVHANTMFRLSLSVRSALPDASTGSSDSIRCCSIRPPQRCPNRWSCRDAVATRWPCTDS